MFEPYKDGNDCVNYYDKMSTAIQSYLQNGIAERYETTTLRYRCLYTLVEH